jgi:hypothetical protein
MLLRDFISDSSTSSCIAAWEENKLVGATGDDKLALCSRVMTREPISLSL